VPNINYDDDDDEDAEAINAVVAKN